MINILLGRDSWKETACDSWQQLRFSAKCPFTPRSLDSGHSRGEEVGSKVIDCRIGEVLKGKYEILRRLAAGGMGTVYEARDVILGQRFAVKILHSEFAGCAGTVQRFLRESALLAALPHEHLVAVVDSGEVRGVPFFVMELLSGQDLLQLLVALRRLPVRRAVSLALDVCCALGAAHDAGLIHRDLKPANIFVTCNREGREVAKVLDFGVAKLRDVAGGTGEGTLIGTLGYMAPEQITAGHEVDHRADIYSLGIILYEAISGERAHPGKGLGALHSIVNEDPPLLDLRRRNLPSGLGQVVARAMARAPAERYASVSQFAAALQPFVRWSTLARSPHSA